MIGPSLRLGLVPSIRRSLAAWLLLPLTLLVPCTAALFYTLSLRPALDSLDHALDGTALALEGLVHTDGQRVALNIGTELDRVLRADRFDNVWWAVLGPDGQLLSGDAELAMLAGPPGSEAWRFADARHQGRPVRVALHAWACTNGRMCEVRVAETLNKRHGVEQAVLTAAATAMLLEALVLALMGWVAISRGLRPVERLSAEIEGRAPDQLSPVEHPDIPREVAPLISALNGLFARVTAATATEKAFLADAAHQLRTPLTALRTEIELALLEPHPPQLAPLLQRLHQGATRSARLAHQLLSQARTEHDAKNAPMEPCDLKQIASEAVEDWVQPSLQAGVDLGFELQPAPVLGRAYLLREMLDNLLDNALLYAGSGARVTVRTLTATAADERAHAVLEVEDSGPGIPPEERARAFERFQRGPRAGGSGSGLGLSIVRDIARHHRARVELMDGPEGRGLRVRVSFPPDA